jgi:hypothetical protein
VNISDEAVEAAAKVLYAELGGIIAPDVARLALEAAAPHMLGYVPENHTGTDFVINPYRSQA